jgi:exodeoxyribonuclease V alpha subunit
MSEIVRLDPNDRRAARRASGLLAGFNQVGALEAADVHVASRFGALSGEADDQVLLAVALAVRAARLGAVCVNLTTIAEQDPQLADLPWPDPGPWTEAVEASSLVRGIEVAGDQQRRTGTVLRLVRRPEGQLLYLDRHWREEDQVCADLLARLALVPPELETPALDASADRLFGPGWVEQREASLKATRQWTTVLTGGPGTGKTASVARMLVLIAEQHEQLHGRPPRIALAAPTGKASARLEESVSREAATLEPSDRSRLDGLRAGTLHRLLGWRPDSGTRFKHNRENPLPYDVVVVDEVSMVSLSQMARLLEAVRPTTRLVLVGDPDQLASVEAGAVLADIVNGFGEDQRSPVARLTVPHRIRSVGGAATGDLDELASALRRGDADAAVALLTSGSAYVRLVDPSDEPAMAVVRAEIGDAAYRITEKALGYDPVADPTGVTDLLDEHRLLCAHREGPYGVAGWNRQVERLVADRTGITHYDEWYAGRQVLITANDRGLGISNGDIGAVVRVPDGRLRVLLRSGNDVRQFAPTRLSGVETVFAMTVHKSQGSEARAVTLVLPPEESHLLTRELFYTAVTRARERVTIVGTEGSLRAAVARQVQRASGLADRLSSSAAG